MVSQVPRRTGSGTGLSQLSPEGMPGGVKEQVDGTMSQVMFFSHAVDDGVLFTLSVGSCKLLASLLAITQISRVGGGCCPALAVNGCTSSSGSSDSLRARPGGFDNR